MAGCKARLLCILCLLSWFVFNQQNICRKILRRISGVLKLQRIILKSKSAVSEQEILLTIEKNKRWAECADEKHVNNVTFGATVCFNGCQTSNVWPAKHVLSGTLFSGRSRGRPSWTCSFFVRSLDVNIMEPGVIGFSTAGLFGSLFVQWLILFVPADTFPSIVTSLWWYCIFAPFS